MKYKKITDKIKKEICEEYQKQHMTVKQLADQWGISQNSIYKWLKKAGIKCSRNRHYQYVATKRPDSATKENLIYLHSVEKWSYQELATYFGVSYQTICNWIKRDKAPISGPREIIINETDFIDLYCIKKMTISEIADYFHVHETTILYYIKKHHIVRNKERSSISESEKDVIRALYQSGKSIREIAAIYKVEKHAMSNYMKKHEIPLRNKGGKKPQKLFPEYKDMVSNLYWEQGKSITEIAKLYQVQRSTLLDYMAKRGIDTGNSTKDSMISEAERENIYDLYYNQGKSAIEIAEIYHVHASTIHAYMRKVHIPSKRTFRLLSKKQEEIKDLYYNQGKSVKEIAEIYHVSYESMRTYICRYFKNKKS